MRNYEYRVFHGWAFPEYVVTFKTMTSAVKYIEAQENPDEWCFEKAKKENRDEKIYD